VGKIGTTIAILSYSPKTSIISYFLSKGIIRRRGGGGVGGVFVDSGTCGQKRNSHAAHEKTSNKGKKNEGEERAGQGESTNGKNQSTYVIQ